MAAKKAAAKRKTTTRAKRAKATAAAGAGTPPVHRPLPEALKANVWKPGQSGNPAGKPKGARNKLSEAFVTALFEDFQKATEEGGQTQGEAAIAKVREEDPTAYLKVIAALAPKQVHIKEDVLDAFDDDELSAAMAAVVAIRQTRGAGSENPGQDRAPGGKKPH